MANRLQGIEIVISGDTTPLTKSLDTVNSELRKTNYELNEVDKLLKLDPSNVELLAQKQKLLQKTLEETSKKLKQLKDAQVQVNEQFARGDISEEQFRAFNREVEKTEIALKKVQNQVEKFNNQKLDKVAGQLEKVGQVADSAGKKLLKISAVFVGIGTALTKVAVDAIKTGDAIEENAKRLGISATE